MSGKETTTKRVKVNKLTLDKETIKDLSEDEAQKIKGGASRVCNSNGCGANFSHATQQTCASYGPEQCG